jgi:hypothetical protein
MAEEIENVAQADNAAPATDAPIATVAPAEQSATLLASVSSVAKPTADVSGWPEGLMEKIAGGDAKKQAALSRYKTHEDALNALVEAQAKIRTGEFKGGYRPDMKPDELTAWRESNGIPTEPEKYDVKLAEGMVLSDLDKQGVEIFKKTAIDLNLHPDQLNGVLGQYFKLQSDSMTAMAQKEVAAREENETKLLGAFGDKQTLDSTLAGVFRFVDSAPEGVREAIMNGVDRNGMPLADNADLITWLAEINTKLNGGDATVTPSIGSVGVASTEYADLKKLMAGDHSDYWKGPHAARHQARFRELTAKGVQ